MNIILLTLINVLLITPLFADTIYLKSGKKLDGKIWKEDTATITIVSETQFGIVPLPVKRSEIEKVERTKGENDIIERCSRSLAYFKEGVNLYNRKQYSNAIESFNNAKKNNPKLGLVNYYIGLSYAKLNRYHEAIGYYFHELEINQKEYKAYHQIGYAYSCLSEYKQAIDYYQKALEINPNDGSVYFGMGVSYASLGQNTEAREKLHKAKELFQIAGDYEGMQAVEETISKLP